MPPEETGPPGTGQPATGPPGTGQPGTGGETPAQTRPRRLVVWRPDQVALQHDVMGLGDLRDDTVYGRLLVRSLMRAQLGLSLMCLAVALALTLSYPVLAAMVPAISRFTVGGIPLTLIVLGFAFYPVLLGIGWFYNRHARKLEASFTDLVAPARQRPED